LLGFFGATKKLKKIKRIAMEKHIVFINELSEFLEITPPLVSFDTSHFPTATTIAQYEVTGDTIHLNKAYTDTGDFYFALAHELRHAWQFKKHKEVYFKNYRSNTVKLSIEAYNLQPAEIDANAFATIIVADYFGLKPLYNGLSQKVKDAIKRRVDEIMKEYSE
jgi:hypothetical protein